MNCDAHSPSNFKVYLYRVYSEVHCEGFSRRSVAAIADLFLSGSSFSLPSWLVTGKVSSLKISPHVSL